MGSDSKVSWGTTSEDVGVAEEERRVQSVFEQERGRLLVDAILEPETGVDAPDTGVPVEGADVGLEPGTWVLTGGGEALAGWDACELTAGAAAAEDVAGGGGGA